MKSPAPASTQELETLYKHPGQDESGKTDAPMSETGKDTLKREEMEEKDKQVSK